MKRLILTTTLAILAFFSVSHSRLLGSLWQYDKALHIGTYAFLTVIFSISFPKIPPLSISVRLFAFSAVLEIVQPFFGRSADFADLGANAVGIFFVGYFFNFLFTQLFNYQFFMKKIFTILLVAFSTVMVSAQCPNPPCTLPVSLTYFKAETKGATVQLAWATEAEKDASHFIVERGAFTNELKEIARVNCNNKPSTYQFIDDAPLSTGAYYRLSQVDLDGKREIFKAIYVESKGSLPQLFGNIVSDVLYLTSEADVYVADTFGRVVALAKSVNSLTISELPNGLYIVRIERNGKYLTTKVLKL